MEFLEVAGGWRGAFLYAKKMHFVDKYESNHTGDGQTDGQTRTDEFVRSNVMTPGVTERKTLMTRVSQNVGH